MHLEHVVPNQLVQQVAPFARTWTTTTDQQTGFLAGSDRLVLGMLRRASHRLRHHRNPRPPGTIGESLFGHGLCEGLDVSLRGEEELGLITCVGEGLVSCLHLLGEAAPGSYYLTSWKLKSSRNCLRFVNNERRKLYGMEKRNAHFMHG